MSRLGSTWVPCTDGGEGRPRDLVDRTNGDLARTYAALGGAEGRPVYMEVRTVEEAGAQAWAGPMMVLDVRRAAQMSSRACNELWGYTDLRARGNEPFWLVSVAGSVLSVTRPGATPLHMGPVQVDVQGTGRVYRVVTRTRRVELRVADRRCVDGMSGEQFALSVEASIDGEVLTGCAAERPDDLPQLEESGPVAAR
jgi:uncharacterized membrane protein